MGDYFTEAIDPTHWPREDGYGIVSRLGAGGHDCPNLLWLRDFVTLFTPDANPMAVDVVEDLGSRTT